MLRGAPLTGASAAARTSAESEGDVARFAVIPAKRSNAMEASRRYKIVVGCLLLAALLGPLGLLLSLARAPQPVDVTTLQPLGRGLSEVVARDYLAGRVPDVPHVKDFDPKVLGRASVNGFQPLQYDYLAWERFERAEFGPEFEVNYFVVIPSAREAASDQPLGATPPTVRPLQVAVSTLITPEGEALLAAVPTIELWEKSGASSDLSGSYQDLPEKIDPGEAPGLQAQLERWAKAYAEGNSDDLRTYANEDDRSLTYPGLGGFTSQGVQVLSLIPAGENLFVARARVQLVGAQGSVSEGFQSEVEFDILVSDLDKADPGILAWGPAGSAGTLEPYDNAVPTS